MSGLRLVSSTPSELHGLIGAHPTMRTLFDRIRRVAPLDRPALVQGASGTGKELVARALHGLSGRTGLFLAVNVATLSESLLESELFGHVRGAFTGAVATRKGLLASAAGGTLYLDEAAELSPALQAKLLRVLETHTVRPVGASREDAARFRLVASIQQPAAELLARGRWREDFFYRVASRILTLPSLAERPSDLPLLSDHFLAQLGRPPLDRRETGILAAYPWPGNVRELQLAIDDAAFEAEGGRVTAGDIVQAAMARRQGASAPVVCGPVPSPSPAERTLEAVDRAHIGAVLRETDGNIRAAAAILGLSKSSLHRRLVRLRLRVPDPG